MSGASRGALARLERLEGWLLQHALPLWWEAGADHEGGGFFEGLHLDGTPDRGPRRVRVQARQTFVYVAAGELGWEGPWRDAARHGLDYLLARYPRPDGLYRPLADMEPGGREPQLYDQAFVLLALAYAKRAGLAADADDRALALLDAVERGHRHDAGGFREADGARPFQSNPLMHLLESSLAWAAVDGSQRWTALADELAELALTRLIDGDSGLLREFFGADWRPAAGTDGRRVEPGHQFEWAWLLHQWERLGGGRTAAAASERLWRNGLRHGLDPLRRVAVNEIRDDGAVLDPNTRLWPQTERLRTSALHAGIGGHIEPDLWSEVEAAADGLLGYLQTPIAGLWRAKRTLDGEPLPESAPATSFYHVVGAIQAFRAAVRGDAPRSEQPDLSAVLKPGPRSI